jgi:hypothetical protein
MGASGPASPPVPLLVVIISVALLPPPPAFVPVDAVELFPPLPVLNCDEELLPLWPHDTTANTIAAKPAIDAPAYFMP